MKRSFLIILTLIFGISAYSQTLLKQDVISSAGGFNTASGISISWTLGETIIPTFTSTDNTLILTHGFQQQLIITAIEENLGPLVDVSVFPNPASDNVNIRFGEPLDSEVRLMVVSSQGKPVRSVVIEPTTVEKQINLQDLPSGVYYLRMTKGKLSNVYKVVKL
jgi:hypothetical protein